MGPRLNQKSILLAQIHAEKQNLVWRLDNSGIQTWTPQRDVHFKHIVRQQKKVPDYFIQAVGITVKTRAVSPGVG